MRGLGILRWIEAKHLSWLLTETGETFDTSLSRMPTTAISWSYAVDQKTMVCRLQLMMRLLKLREEYKKPLPNAKHLMPTYITMWNTLKGPIDNLSKVLAHLLGVWGPISPMLVIIIRVWSTMNYNAWRLYTLGKNMEYLHGPLATTWLKVMDARNVHGGTFEDFMMELITTMKLPPNTGPVTPGRRVSESGPPQQLARPDQKQKRARAEYNTPTWQIFRTNRVHQHLSVHMSQLPELLSDRMKETLAKADDPFSVRIRLHCRYCTKSTAEVDENGKRKYTHDS